MTAFGEDAIGRNNRCWSPLMLKGMVVLAARFISLLLIASALILIQTPAYSQEQVARVGSFVGEVFVRSQVTAPAGRVAPLDLCSGQSIQRR